MSQILTPAVVDWAGKVVVCLVVALTVARLASPQWFRTKVSDLVQHPWRHFRSLY